MVYLCDSSSDEDEEENIFHSEHDHISLLVSSSENSIIPFSGPSDDTKKDTILSISNSEISIIPVPGPSKAVRRKGNASQLFKKLEKECKFPSFYHRLSHGNIKRAKEGSNTGQFVSVIITATQTLNI